MASPTSPDNHPQTASDTNPAHNGSQTRQAKGCSCCGQRGLCAPGVPRMALTTAQGLQGNIPGCFPFGQREASQTTRRRRRNPPCPRTPADSPVPGKQFSAGTPREPAAAALSRRGSPGGCVCFPLQEGARAPAPPTRPPVPSGLPGS